MANPTTPNSAPTIKIRDGWVITGFGDHRNDWGPRIAVQKDGKVLVADISDGLIGLARYNTDGSLDTSFSGDGKLTADLGMSMSGVDFGLQPDGTIVVYRHTYSGLTISHFTPSGDLVTSWGTNGTLTSAGATGLANIYSLTVLGDGRIVTAGSSYGDGTDYLVRRYNADGTFDTSFDTDGKATVDIGNEDNTRNMLVQPDGKILLVGQSTYWPAPGYSLVRLNSIGAPDTTFSGDGNVTIDVGTGYNYMRGAMALQTDRKIVVGAESTAFQSTEGIKLLRYTTDGSLDTSFHGTGSVTLKADWFKGASLEDISILKDGKILALGNAEDANQTPYTYIARFLPDGTLDQTFGNKGLAQAARPAHTYASATELLVQPDGKILVTGGVSVGTNDTDLLVMRFNADGSVDQTFAPAKNMMTSTSTFIEGTATSPGKPVVLNNAIQVHDTELAAIGYQGASLTLIRHEGANADDVFSARSGGTLSALTSGSDFSVGGVTIGHVTINGAGKLTLTFGANATEALVNQALQQIAYANTSDTPSSNVLIDWTFSDGNTGAQGTGGTLKAVDGTTVTILTTNDTPVAHGIPDQKASGGYAFSYVIPESTFTDPDHDTLGYSVVTADGKALPSWLGFDPATHTLSGTPNTTDIGALNLRVTARDGSGATASTYFTLNVLNASMHVDGTAGADNLVGTAGNDIIQGFAGNDTLDGKAGADMLSGGDGNDLYYVDNVGDVVTEIAGGGADIVYTTLASYKLAPNVEHGRLLSSGQADLVGNELANALYAGSGNNILDGGLGIDIVSYAYATAGVTVTLGTTQAQDTEGSGIDTLRNIENLAGSRFDDNLLGNQANNILNGGAGADFMAGGNGSDLYAVDNAGDIVRETNADATVGGIDTVESSIAFTLGANVENLTLTGTGAINGTGNVLANKLLGNSGNNVLNGGAGIDTMAGGLGNDTYYVDNAGDVVSEAPGAGTDTVISTVTRTLGDNQENLTLAGTAAINGTGNALANNIIGNAAANTLTGGLGKDVLEGGGGSDVFVFNASTETGVTSAAWDVINDFVRGQDKLDLRGIDANTATTTNDAFTTFIAATAAFTAAGQLKFVNGVLYGNTDGDADAEFAIQLTGITQLTTADVML